MRFVSILLETAIAALLLARAALVSAALLEPAADQLKERGFLALDEMLSASRVQAP